MTKESEVWNQFAENYDKEVFSITSIPERKKQILELINPGLTLNLGCGPTSYLNKDLIKNNHNVIASDFCQEMINYAKKNYINFQLEYILADSRKLPFKDNTFDSVISVNSILPEKRKDVLLMVNEIKRVLKHRGAFIAWLPAYNSDKEIVKKFGKHRFDRIRKRIWDTTGWQCYHTSRTINKMMRKSKFGLYNFKKIFLNTKKEKSEFKRLYDFDDFNNIIYEFLLEAYK